MDEIKKIASKLSKGAILAFGRAKKLINYSFSNDLEKQLELEAEYIKQSAGTRDFQEGIKAFLEKREPSFEGK